MAKGTLIDISVLSVGLDSSSGRQRCPWRDSMASRVADQRIAWANSQIVKKQAVIIRAKIIVSRIISGIG